MMPLSTFLFLSMGLFAVNGMLRGWYKEFLATVGAVLAVFVITLVEKYVPVVNALPPKTLFFVRVGIFSTITFFGYQTPRFSAAKRNVSGMMSIFLGMVLGAVNGYLVVGMLWHYLAAAGYPWPNLIAPPSSHDKLTQALLQYLPNSFLGVPGIYIVSALMFVFVIVIFV